MSEELETALSITGDIYDAALDPGLWPGVMRRLGDFVGGSATALLSLNVAARTEKFHFVSGDNPEYTRTYQQTYVRLNPIVPPLMLLKPGDIWTVTRVMPMKQFHATRFYQEWVKPQGYGDIVGAMVDRSGATVTSVATSIRERDSPANEQAKRRLSLILPHIRRAISAIKKKHGPHLNTIHELFLKEGEVEVGRDPLVFNRSLMVPSNEAPRRGRDRK